ncbi:low-density lipoprotein receptor-related protein 12-like isoform X2 [Patiria miniata]|uniref:CUB domain-containing protein n=1 Tax=Patiria miniata TaxID=46514 RepID=A0A914AVZ9_PATMI|nr:low-density lipoprotein receptor-related protein 12-like isoform X2 [Patiria miniata]
MHKSHLILSAKNRGRQSNMANLQIQRIIAVGFLTVLIGAGNAAHTVYMDEKCGETIQAGRSGGVVTSLRGTYYENDYNCTITITADIGRQILLTFDRVDIEGTPSGDSGCDGDYLEVYNGTSTILSPVQVICGTSANDIVSFSNSVTLRFKTDPADLLFSTERGFFLSYTSFTTISNFTSCDSGEFKCDNNRCIGATFKNNMYDNCGDNSDEGVFVLTDLDPILTTDSVVFLNVGMIALVAGCIGGAVVMCIGVCCICYFCCKTSRPHQQTSYQVVAQTPRQQQQPPMAMQPTGQPGQQAPYGQPGAYPPGQPAYPPDQQAYPPGQPAYAPDQPAYPPGQPVYPPGQAV